jgi:hypothetical protein
VPTLYSANPDVLALRFQLSNAWRAFARTLAQNLINLTVLGAAALILVGSIKPWQFLPGPTAHPALQMALLAVLGFLVFRHWRWQRLLRARQQQDWLAAAPIAPATRTAFRLGAGWVLAALAGLCVFAVSATLLPVTYAASIVGVACLGSGIAGVLANYIPLPRADRSPVRPRSRALFGSRDRALRGGDSHFQRHQLWWRQLLPHAAARARWWFVPALLLPAGISGGAAGLALLGAFCLMQLLAHAGAAERYANASTKVLAACPHASKQLLGMMAKLAANAAAAPLMALSWIAWRQDVMALWLVAVLATVYVWQICFAFALRHQASAKTSLHLRYGAALLILMSIQIMLFLPALFTQCLLLIRRGHTPQDVLP